MSAILAAVLCLQLKSVYPLAIIHVVGNVLTNVSLGKVAVSFTHTVKVRLLLEKPALQNHRGVRHCWSILRKDKWLSRGCPSLGLL